MEEIEELKQTIQQMKSSYDNKFKGMQLDIDKANKILRHIDLLKLSAITKGQEYESNVK